MNSQNGPVTNQYKRYNHSAIVELGGSYHAGYMMIKSLMDYGRVDSIIFCILDNVINKVCGMLSEYNSNNKIDVKDVTQNIFLLNGDSYNDKLKEAIHITMLELSNIGVLLTLEEGVDLVSRVETAIIEDMCTTIPDLNTEYIKVTHFTYLGNAVVKLDLLVNEDT